MDHFDDGSCGVAQFHPYKEHGTMNQLFGLLCSPDTGSSVSVLKNGFK